MVSVVCLPIINIFFCHIKAFFLFLFPVSTVCVFFGYSSIYTRTFDNDVHNIYFYHYIIIIDEKRKENEKRTESHRIIIRPKKKMEYKFQFVNIENENFSHFSNWFLESFSFHSTTTTTKKMNLSEYNVCMYVKLSFKIIRFLREKKTIKFDCVTILMFP